MSTDFNAFFNVRITRSADEWMRRVAIAGPHVAALISKWRHRWRIDAWSIKDPAPMTSGSNFPTIWGPGGFAIHVFEKAAELYHCSPWGLFLRDPEHQRLVRAACYELAQVFKSEIAIFAPELSGAGVRDGEDAESVRQQLESNWGAPAASLSELAANQQSARGWHHPGCYYVDHLTDLLAPARNESRDGT